MDAWSFAATLVPLIFGAVGLIAWMAFKNSVPCTPTVPLGCLGNRTAMAAFVGTLVLSLIQFGLLYYLLLYYQISKGSSPMASGLALLPQCLLSGPTTALTGALIANSGRYRLTIWVGSALFSLGCGLFVLLDSSTTVSQWISINVVAGFELGALLASQSAATQAAMSQEHQATVSGLTPFFRAIGQAFGIVVGDAVFQNVLRRHLTAAASSVLHEQAATLFRDVAGLALLVRTLPAGSKMKHESLLALHGSLHVVWWASIAFALFPGLLSLLIRQLSLDREPSRDHIEKTGDAAAVEQTVPIAAEPPSKPESSCSEKTRAGR